MPEAEVREGAASAVPDSAEPDSRGVFDDDGLLDVDGLAAEEARLHAAESFGALFALYQRAAAHAPEPAIGRQVLARAAALALGPLADPRRAVPLLRRILASAPDDPEALEGLARAARAEGWYEEAADLEARRAEVLPDAEKVGPLVALAELCVTKLAETDRALWALRAAYELDPSRWDVLVQARALFEADGRYADAQQVLDDEVRTLLGDAIDEGDEALAARAQEIFDAAATEADEDGPDHAAAEAVRRLAAEYARLGATLLTSATHHDLAQLCLETARALGDEGALARLDELAALRTEWQAHAQRLRDQGFEAPQKRRAAELYLQAAELYARYGQDALRADEYVDRCLILSPGFAPALRYLEAVHRAQGREGDLVKRFNALAQSAKDPAVKADILLRVAQLHESTLPEEGEPEPEQVEAIVNAYRRLLALVPGHQAAVLRLGEILEAEGRIADLAQVLEGRLAALESPYAKSQVHLQLGRVHAERLGDSPRARNHFEAVLDLFGDHFEAASALRALYKDANESPLLLGVQKVLLDHCPDVFSRLDLLAEMAEVAADVGAEEHFGVRRAVFELDPAAPGARERLEALAGELGRYRALADAFAGTAARCGGDKALELWVAAGRLYDDKLPRPADAIRCFREVLRLDAGHAEAQATLERLLQQQDDPEALVEMLEAQLSRAEAGEAANVLRAKIGHVRAQRLEDYDGAIRMFEAVLADAPEDPGALAHLDDLYGRAERFADQARVLDRRVDAADPAERADLLARRAALAVDALSAPEDGARLLLEVLAQDPDHRAAEPGLAALLARGVEIEPISRALEPVYAQRGRYDRQRAMLDARLATASGEAAAALALRASEVADARLADPQAALRYALRAVRETPAAEPPLSRALELTAAHGDAAATVEALEAVLNGGALPAEVTARIASAAAELCERDLADPNRAIAHDQRVLDADPANGPAIAALQRLLGAEARYAELAALLERRISDTDDRDARVQLGLALASIREAHLEDLDGAISALKDVLAVAPEDGAALGRHAELLARAERHRDLVPALDRLRAVTQDPEAQAQIEVRAADVLRQHLDDAAGALARYGAALDLRPGLEAAVHGLERLLDDPAHGAAAGARLAPGYEAEGRYGDLVLALESQLAGTRDKPARAALFTRIADVEAGKLDQAQGAFETLSRAFREHLLDAEGQARLAELAQKAGRARELAGLYEDALETTEAPEDLLRSLARLYDGAAAEPAKARGAWERLVARAPKDTEALEALERLTAAGDDPAALGRVLEQRADVAEAVEDKVSFLTRAAAIHEEAAQDVPSAIRVMEAAGRLAPEDPAVLTELARLYAATGADEPLEATLTALLEQADEPRGRANLRVRRAAARVRQGAFEGAIEDYAAALGDVPELAAAREGLEALTGGPAAALAALALEPVYRAAGDWARLVDAYEILVGASEDPAERVERLVAIRSIYEERLGQTERAFAAATRAWRESPTSEELLADLERLGKLSGQVEVLMGVLEDQAEALPYVSEERAALRLRVARYAETLLQDRGRAIEGYRRALEERPDAMGALEALERLHADHGDHRDHVAVLRKMAGILEDPTAQAGRLRAAARILEEHLSDRDQAAHLYEQVIMLAPDDAEALRRLDGLYAQARASEDLARVLKQRIALAEGAEQAALRLRLGQLAQSALEDPRLALETFEAVLGQGEAEAQGAFDGALYALDDLMEAARHDAPQLAAAAARAAEPIWSAKGQLAKVVAAKEVQGAAAEDAAGRRAILVQIADLYEAKLDEPSLAFLALTRAYAEHPNDGELVDRLDGLAARAETYEELAEVFGQALPSVEDRELALRLARRTAALYDARLGRPDVAVAYYRWVLELVPSDPEALAALERIHTRRGDAASLVEVYRGMLKAAETDEARMDLHGRLAELFDSELSDTDGAFASYRAMQKIAPEDRSVLKRMAGLCERAGRWQDLAEVLEADAEIATGDEEAQVRLRLGTVLDGKLSSPTQAVRAFADVLALRSGDPGAIAGLASIVREAKGGRSDAARVLAPVYRDSGAFAEYVECLEIQVDAEDEADARRDLLVELAEVYESRLGRPERAFTAAQRALHEDPADGGVRARLERLAGEGGQLEELAAFYLDEIDAVRDHDLGVMLRRRVAEIYDHELEDVPRAIAEYGRVLDVAPGDGEALEALERLYRAAGSFGSLADVYRRRIAQSDDDATRAKLLREFSRLQARELSDAPGAIASLRRLLEIEPEDLDALSRLAGLCEQQGRASELADVLERLVAAAPEGSATRLDAQLALGRLKLDKLGDVGGAESLFADVLSAAPDHEGTRELLQERFEDAAAEEDLARVEAFGGLLADAMRRTEAWESLISVLRMRARLARTDADRVPLEREVAEVYEARLDQPELAFAALGQVYTLAPGLEEVREGLDRLAGRLLMWEELVEVLQAGLPKALDGEVAEQLRRRIAQVLDQQVADAGAAIDAWQELRHHAPNDPEALAALDRLNEAQGRWAALADVLERRVELAEGEAKHGLCLRLGALWDERLSEPEEAIAWYRKARAEAPRDRETLLSLARLLDAEAHGQELYAVLEALNEQSSDDRERVRLEVRLGELAQGSLRRPGVAIEHFRRALALDEAQPKAVEALEALYEQEGQWAELAALLERQVERARDEAELLRLQRRLGLVKGTRLGSPDEAIRSWSEILKRNPNDVEALEALRQIYRSAARWDELVSVLRKLIPLQTETDGIKQIRFELAEVHLEHLEDRDEAIESAKRVLDVEPHTGAELMALEEIFVKCKAYSEAVRVMNFRAEQADNRADRIEILFDIAEVYTEQVGRTVGAAQAYERILEVEPTSGKAYEALAAIYEKNGDYRRLVELYNRRLEVTEEAASRRKLLYAIIDIQERWLGHSELAFTAACRAFAEEGADEEAQRIAERLAEETDNWEILAEVFEEQVEQVGVARAVDLRRRLGEIRLDLDEPEQAEKQFEMVLSMRLDDDAAREQLVQLYGRQGRWRDLIAQLTDRVELATELEDKKRVFERIARIEEEEVGDVEAAISSLKRILDLDPEDAASLAALTRLFRAHDKWHPLLNVLQRRLELAGDAAERLELKMEIGGVYEQGLEDLDLAGEQYKEVLGLDAGHMPALLALERLYVQQERWIELVDVYERQVGLTDDSKAAIEILTRVANIWEEQFRDLEGASKTLIRVLEVEPEHLPTVKSLERIWQEAEDWEHLVEAKERHIELVDDGPEKVRLHLQTGDVLLRELGRVDEAERAYGSALALDPGSREATHALGQLHERHGNWFNALEMLSREAALLGAQPEAVEIHHRVGKINAEMLMDREAAKAAYDRALDIDPGYGPSLRALRQMNEEEDRFDAVIRLLAQEAQYCPDPGETAELFAQGAELALEHFDDEDQAISLFDRALEADGAYVPALRTQADLRFSREEWEDAERLLSALVDELDRGADHEELCRQYYRLAYIAEKLGDDAQALKRYLASYELDATYLPTLEGLGAALLRSERWADAQRIFQTILIQHRTSLTDAEVVDLHWQIGELAMNLDELDRAEKSFGKALDLDPAHPPTRLASARLSERLGEWEDAYDHRDRLIQVLGGEELFEALVDQARLCEEKIQEPYRAVDAYEGARRERPDDVDVLRALARLYDETGQVAQAVEVLNDLGLLLEDPAEQRDLYMQLADLHWTQERNAAGAVTALNNALDLDPGHVAAFSKIEQVLYEVRDWTALERNYHRMLERLPKENRRARLVLWRSVGDLYAKVLKNPDGARVAYEVVLNKLDPDAHDVALALAELYASKRETAPKAVQLYQRILGKVEDPAAPARRLFELYHALGQLDRAFCALGALVLMRAATEDEVKAYALLLKKAPPWPTRALTDTLWRSQVLHPWCRNALGDILSVLYRGAPGLFEEPQRALKLGRRERVDLAAKGKNARARLRYFDVWQRLHGAMHVGDMEHFHRAGTGQGPRMYPGSTPVLFAGDQHEVFKTMPPRLIAWTLARQMACARPELAPLRSLMAPDEIGAAVEAAVQLFLPEGSGVDLALDPARVQAWLQAIPRAMSDRALKALREPVSAAIQKRDVKRMRRFLEGCEHSASRAALLFAGDVAAAERGLGESDQLVDVSYRARVRELMLFTLSDEHFELREKLGLAIRA